MDRKPRKTVKILHVNTDSTSMDGVLRQVQSSFEKKQQITITTPNPEIVLKSLDDDILRRAINNSDIRVPDGMGLAAAAMFLKMKRIKNRTLAPIVYFVQGLFTGLLAAVDPGQLKNELNIIKGRVLFLELIKLANKKNWRVFLLGGFEDTSCKTKKELQKNYKGIKIECSTGPVLDEEAVPINSEEKRIEKVVIEDINRLNPHLVFVAFGAPKQEKWVAKWKENLNAGVIMVVGGAFDYYIGNLRLPPRWIDGTSFEWLWRLIMQPKRFMRIFNAVVRFSWKVFLFKVYS